jgi:hypothetical protein
MTTSGLMARLKWFGNALRVGVARFLALEFEKSPQAAGHLALFKALRMLEQQRE